MAVMTAQDRSDIWAELQSDLSATRDALPGFTKADFLTAVQATDQWLSDNAASFNSALPLAVRSNLTSSQKARLLMAVARKRWNVGV